MKNFERCTLEDNLDTTQKDKMPGKYEEIAIRIGKLVDEKNQAYGNSFNVAGDILRLHYPDGVKPEQYDDMLALVRIFDKTMRIAHDRDALGETPFADLAGYGILGTERVERLREVKIEVPEEDLPPIPSIWSDNQGLRTRVVEDALGRHVLQCKTCGNRCDLHGCGVYETGGRTEDDQPVKQYVCCVPRGEKK